MAINVKYECEGLQTRKSKKKFNLLFFPAQLQILHRSTISNRQSGKFVKGSNPRVKEEEKILNTLKDVLIPMKNQD